MMLTNIAPYTVPLGLMLIHPTWSGFPPGGIKCLPNIFHRHIHEGCLCHIAGSWHCSQLFTDSVLPGLFTFNYPLWKYLQQTLILKLLKLGSWHFERRFTSPKFHASGATRQVSGVMCPMAHENVTCNVIFLDRVLKLVSGGSVINKAYYVSFKTVFN